MTRIPIDDEQPQDAEQSLEGEPNDAPAEGTELDKVRAERDMLY